MHSHNPTVRVAPSATLHGAHCPVGTAFIQHDRTSLLCFSPRFSLLPLSHSYLIDLCFHLFILFISILHIPALEFFFLSSVHPFISVTLCGHSSAKQSDMGSRAVSPICRLYQYQVTKVLYSSHNASVISCCSFPLPTCPMYAAEHTVVSF